jgi:hypothetical protein
LEELYWSECSETIQVGRVRVFEEFLTVFNCSVLTFWSAIKFHREYNPRVRYNMHNKIIFLEIHPVSSLLILTLLMLLLRDFHIE